MTDNEMKWFLLGKILRRNLMAGQKEPIAYLYNGYKYPAIPADIKATYPYLYIRIHGRSECVLYALDAPCTCGYFEGDDGELFFGSGPYPAPTNYMELSVATDSSGNATSNVWERSEPKFSETGFMTITSNKPRWSNHDIIDRRDGSVWFAASEPPVPVYE